MVVKKETCFFYINEIIPSSSATAAVSNPNIRTKTSTGEEKVCCLKNNPKSVRGRLI